MKYLLQILLLLCVLSYHANSQSLTDTGFAGQKQRIDSITAITDSNKMLTHNLFLGSLVWGSFNANIFYMVGTPVINKAEYFFTTGSAGKKIFYYNNNQLIKVIDNGTEYYYDSKLFDKSGKPIKDYIAKDLVLFSQESYRMMLSMIQ